MNELALPLVLLTSFLGSFHCAAMCGPFVGYYAMGARRPAQNHLTYQLGRLVAYLSLGCLAGLIGRGLLYFGIVIQAQRALMILMGVLMIGAGLLYYLPLRYRPNSGPLYRQVASFIKQFLGERGSPMTAGLIGLCSTLLPCGYLYGFVIAAGASGHPFSAMAIMAAFWLGSLPALLTLGIAARHLGQRFLQRAQKLVPAFLILFGILAIAGKWTHPGYLEEGAKCLETWSLTATIK